MAEPKNISDQQRDFLVVVEPADSAASSPSVTPSIAPEAEPVLATEKRLLYHERPASIFSQSSDLFRRVSAIEGELAVPDLWLHPGLNVHGQNVLHNTANFLPGSCVDILKITGRNHKITFEEDQNDADVEAAFTSIESNIDEPSMMLLCVKLEPHDQATFEYQASISQSLTGKLFEYFDIHSGFLLDLVGRPNYWAAVSQVKADPIKQLDVFELFCQHPRWHQKGRYDKAKKGATQGNKAPCSLYMTHSVATNTTFYIVVAPDDGIWFSFLERIRMGERSHDQTLVSARELVTSPYLVHAMMAGIAFEQATEYAADVRNRLMTQLKQVNDYSDQQSATNSKPHQTGDFGARTQLQRITIQLHSVSQMLNTGLGSISSSVKLSKKLVAAHTAFCQRTGRGRPGTAINRTHGLFQYVLDAFKYQQSWLEQYGTRKETAMSFVFNMVTQQDSSTNLEMSFKISQDSASMHAITILTMVFLPGTFTATLFSSVAFSSDDSGKAEVTQWLWPFIAVTISLTAGVISIWYFRQNIARWRHSMIQAAKRRQLQETMEKGDTFV